MKPALPAIALLLFLPLAALAHGPTPQKGKQSIVINAPVGKVWDAVKAFADLSWHPDVKYSTGDGKQESGGVRTVTLQNGEVYEDELDSYSDASHEYGYRLKTVNVKALPVSSYTTSLSVTAGDSAEQSVVLFKSRFYRGDTGNTPPDNLNDEAAVKAMDAFLQKGLQGLKHKLEN